jgi:hypothetical protein
VSYGSSGDCSKNVQMTQLPSLLFHLAEAPNQRSIEQLGLLSAGDLIERAGLPTVRCEKHRPHRLILPNGVVIRDQKPMPPATLERCLRGMTPGEWYRLLNSKIFLWLDLKRLNRQRNACGPLTQILYVVKTDRLLERYATSVTLAPINSGNARRRPAARGLKTFVPYPDWVQQGWHSEAEERGGQVRLRSHAPVEFTVSRAIPDWMEFVLEVHVMRPGEPLPHL